MHCFNWTSTLVNCELTSSIYPQHKWAVALQDIQYVAFQCTYKHHLLLDSPDPDSPTPPVHSWGRTAPLKKIWRRPKREAQQQSLCAAAERTHTYIHSHTTCTRTHQWCQTGFIRVREGGGRGRRGEEVTAQLGGLRALCVCVSLQCVSSSDLSSLPSVNHRLWHSL